VVFLDKSVNYLYIIGLVLMAVGLSFSNWLMSFSSFWLLGCWAIDQAIITRAERRERWQKALRNPWFYLLLGVYLLHVVWMVSTEHIDSGMRDLRIKLPLLLFPVLFFTFRELSKTAYKFLFTFLALGAGAAALACLMIPVGLWNRPYDNVREISVFISHIRFSILLVFCTAYLLPLIRKQPLWILVIGIYSAFLWTLESVTGFMLLLVVFILFLVHAKQFGMPDKLRKIGLGLFALFTVTITVLITVLVQDYFRVNIDQEIVLEATPSGELYSHNLDNHLRENGHYIWRNIAWGELAYNWNLRSEMSFDSLDGRGQALSITAIRYLTSLGYRKDATGVTALSEEDVAHIERGVTSILEFQHSGMRRRVDKILFEVDNYLNGGNPSGNSIFQRFEFWKASQHIIAAHPLVGVGTGDVNAAMQGAYEEIETQLLPTFRLRPHNQYLTFWVAFGISGPLVLLAIVLLPFLNKRHYRGYLFTVFIVLISLSFITEDSLETQAGVTFFSFFAALFTGQSPNNYLSKWFKTSSAEKGN
jgi:hypothetical protein